jgi:hypothetical protein
MALFADWEKKKHNNNSSPCPSIKDVLVSLASRNCTLLQSKSPNIIEETKTVDEFVYLVLDLFLNHTDHPPGLMIASTIYFGEHSEESPVAYKFVHTNLHSPNIPANMKDPLVMVGVRLNARAGEIKKDQIFDVVLCKNATAAELEAISSGSMHADRVIGMDKGASTAPLQQLKPCNNCRQYVPPPPPNGDQSTEQEAQEAWYQILRAPAEAPAGAPAAGLPSMTHDDGQEVEHAVVNLRVVRKSLNNSCYSLLFFLATRLILTGELLLWQYASTQSSSVVANDAVHFLELTQKANAKGYSVLACQCDVCCTSRGLQHAPLSSRWGPSVLYIDESTTSGTETLTDHTTDALLLEHLVESAKEHIAVDVNGANQPTNLN